MAKTKALISLAVTVFVYANIRFSHDAAHLILVFLMGYYTANKMVALPGN